MSNLLIGDRVRVVSEGSEHDGVKGWLSCVDSRALHYVDTGVSDSLVGPFARNELVEIVDECRHSWVAGFMYVGDEDLVSVARMRSVECERCELTVGPDTDESTLFRLAYGEE